MILVVWLFEDKVTQQGVALVDDGAAERCILHPMPKNVYFRLYFRPNLLFEDGLNP